MRQSFSSFGDVYNYYLFTKASLEGVKCIIPRPDFMDIHSFDAISARSTKEEKLCFVGDVELFLTKKLLPWEANVIEMLYSNNNATFRSLAQWFSRHQNNNIHTSPRLRNHQNVHNAYYRIRDMGQVYFEAKGYIEGDRGRKKFDK